MNEIETLLLSLIEIPSVSGQEQDVANFILTQLSGLNVQKQEVSKGRYNIIVRKGISKKWLVAHMDTVPGTVAVHITEDKIFGRGACDNKQSIAASILLVRELKNINLLLTVGEEEDLIGARKACDDNVCKDAELVIVQEPTRFEIITGQCGIIAFSVNTYGKEQHSSLHDMDNAIHKLTGILGVLESKKWNAFNVGVISGGTVHNVVPSSASAKILVRPKDMNERQAILTTLKDFTEINMETDIVPHNGSCKFPEKIARHFSEMAFFENSIQFGAGDIRDAHTANEYILRKDLNELVGRLKELLQA